MTGPAKVVRRRNPGYDHAFRQMVGIYRCRPLRCADCGQLGGWPGHQQLLLVPVEAPAGATGAPSPTPAGAAVQ